jgi:hypothetical protein
MHYFLGLYIWKRLGDIFLEKGKYTLDILKIFKIQNRISMATLMVTNLKKIYSSVLKLEDST